MANDGFAAWDLTLGTCVIGTQALPVTHIAAHIGGFPPCHAMHHNAGGEKSFAGPNERNPTGGRIRANLVKAKVTKGHTYFSAIA